jgi:hypothetical protein
MAITKQHLKKTNKEKRAGRYFIPNNKPYGDISQLKSIPQSPESIFISGLYKGAFRILF